MSRQPGTLATTTSQRLRTGGNPCDLDTLIAGIQIHYIKLSQNERQDYASDMGAVASGGTFARHKHLHPNPPLLFRTRFPDFREEQKGRQPGSCVRWEKNAQAGMPGETLLLETRWIESVLEDAVELATRAVHDLRNGPDGWLRFTVYLRCGPPRYDGGSPTLRIEA